MMWNLIGTIEGSVVPDAVSPTGFILCLLSPQVAAEFLTYKRGR